MKEQWNISENKTQLENMEEGLYQEKQKCIKRIEYKTICTRCTPYLRLILLLEVMLFFGWGCYMLLQSYRPGENMTTNTFESVAYSSIIESQSDVQKSPPNTEMPVIFVKPELIIDKINNLLEDMKFAKNPNLMQDKVIAPYMMQTNFNNVNNDIMEIKWDTLDRLLMTLSPENSAHDKKFTSPAQRFFSDEYIEKNVDTNKNEQLIRYIQFFDKLRSISKIEEINDLEKLESRNDFTEDINRLTLGNQKNPVLDASNKFENLELYVTTISNPENVVDHTISVDLINTLQDPIQKFFDLIKNAAQDDHNENSNESSLFDETNERINTNLELGFVICPPYESHDMLIKDSIFSSIPHSLLVQKILEQIENNSSDDIERNEDKHDISDMSMSGSTSGNQDHFDVSVTVQNIEESAESIAKIKEDDKYESTKNIKNYKRWFLQPTVQDNLESSTPNIDKFHWFNVPPRFTDFRLEDISKSSEIPDSLSWDMDEDMDVDDIIPGSQCEITIKMGILKVQCPAIEFNEEWNFTSSKIPATDVLKANNFRDIFDVFDVYLQNECNEDANEKLKVENIFQEKSDEEVTSSDRVLKIINALELQENTTNAKILDNALPDLWTRVMNLSDETFIDPFDSKEYNEDSFYDLLYDDFIEKEVDSTTAFSTISQFESSTIDSNKQQNPEYLDISSQHQEQLKISKEQDYSVSDNTKTFLKDFEYFYTLEKNLTSLFKNKISKIMTYLSENSYKNNYRNNICNILRSVSQHPWHKQYVNLRKLLEYIRNPDYPHSMGDSYYRRKRMTDDLTWHRDQVTTLEENDKSINVLQNLTKIFQKMEILALCIDRLHERYLLHNKLDDDYASNEFPIDTEERRELYTSRNVYEK